MPRKHPAGMDRAREQQPEDLMTGLSQRALHASRAGKWTLGSLCEIRRVS